MNFIPYSLAFILTSLMFLSTGLNNNVYGQLKYQIAALIFVILSSLFNCLQSKTRRPLKIIFLIYFVFLFLIPGFYHLSLNSFSLPSSVYTTKLVGLTTLVFAVFIFSFFVGYNHLNFWQVKYKNKLKHGIVFKCDYNYKFIVISFSIISLFLSSYYGWSNLFTIRGEQIKNLTSFELVLVSLIRAFGFLAFLYSIVGKFSKGKLITIAISFMVFLVTNYPLSIPRYLLANYFLTIYILSSTFSPRNRVFFFLSFLVLLLTIFPAVSLLSRGDIIYLLNNNLFMVYLTTGDFDGFQSMINVVKYVEQTGPKYGFNLLSALFFYIPRVMWPTKSPGTGVDASVFMGYDFTNISSPLPAEFYVDFGIFGVLFGGIFVGFLLRRLDDNFFLFRARNYVHYQIILSLLFGSLIILLRGPLVAVLGPISLSILIIYMIIVINKLKFG